MKKKTNAIATLTCIFGLLLTSGFVFAGDNTFPTSGNVGIGTTTPRTNTGDSSYNTIDIRNTLWLGTPATQHGFINSQDSIFLM